MKGTVSRIQSQEQRITDHAPWPRGSGARFGGWIGSMAGRVRGLVDEVPEVGAWTGSRSEMLGTKYLHEIAARITCSPAPI